MACCVYIMYIPTYYTYLCRGCGVSDIHCWVAAWVRMWVQGGRSFCEGRVVVQKECYICVYTVLHASTKERTQSQKSTQKRFPGNGNRSLSPWIDLSAARFRCFPDVSPPSSSPCRKLTAYEIIAVNVVDWKKCPSVGRTGRFFYLRRWRPTNPSNRSSQYTRNRRRLYHNNVRARARARQFIIIACRGVAARDPVTDMFSCAIAHCVFAVIVRRVILY